METITMPSAEMKRFGEIDYQRPDMNALTQQFKQLLASFEQATDFETFDQLLSQINQLRNKFETLSNLVSIRHTVDTNDSFYEDEQEFFDQQKPIIQGLERRYYQLLIKSSFKAQAVDKHGSFLFDLAKLAIKTIDDSVVADLQKENELASQYTKLSAAAKINFKGEELNLSGLTPYEESTDRETRKDAVDAKFRYFEQNKEEYDDIYDQLVKIRTSIARKLGYDNYIGLAYDRLLRTEYGPKEVAAYREQILKHVVPLTLKLRERQAKRLGLDALEYYDLSLQFTSGNATPKGSPDWIIEQGKTMYKELSPETDEFFQFMNDYDLMDLVTKPGKAPGGYCSYLNDFKAPFIYSNFNGTSGDIDVLTHEAGHAFQGFRSRNYELPEYNWPTYEACEIHSMSMEFFTWPWMKSFFKEDTEKYKFDHLGSAVLFLPYGAAVDEFQHLMYEKPEMTPAERDQAWREIEKKYLPFKTYNGNDYLEGGGFWQKQSHIYQSPFYYIDYTLAEVCAFQFWNRAQVENETAWNDYVKLCNAGGSKPFLELVKLAGLKSPFDEGTVEQAIGKVAKWLDAVDDSKL